MIRIRTRLIIAFLLCAVTAFAWGSDIQYTITDLGTLGGPTSEADAISQSGIIAGGAEVPERGDHPFIYQGSGPMRDIGLLDPVEGAVGHATSVNSAGQVVGQSDSPLPGSNGHAFFYSGSGSLIDLGTLGGAASIANGINDKSQIVGGAETASGAWDGALWTVSGTTVTTVDLGQFAAGAINNLGQIAGVCQQTGHGGVYSISSGSITDIGTLGGALCQPTAISDSGYVVGFAETPTSGYAFLYSLHTGVLTNLGNPASMAWGSVATGVNDQGQVVGGYNLDASGAQSVPFIYTQAGGMQNLNNLIDPSSGWTIYDAAGINDAGEIVGSGVNPQGRLDACLLTPTPEPATLQLTAIALTVLAGRLAFARRDTKPRVRQTIRSIIPFSETLSLEESYNG